MSVDTLIAVHPPFAWLVDWAGLAAAVQHCVIVTSAASRERLARENRLGHLTSVVACDRFDVGTIERAIDPWIARAGGPSRVRVATMIEPMQIPVAEVRQRLSILGPSPDALRPFTNKLAMKAAMRGAEAYLPRYLAHDRNKFAADPEGYVARVIHTLGLPIFAKPISENSSAGTARLDTALALSDFLARSPHDLELDEFVVGEGYHLDSVVIEGAVAWFGAGRYLAPQSETLSGAPLGGISIGPGDALFPELERLNATLLGAFDCVPDGCTHLEVLRRPDGRWVFLEVAARVPGGMLPEMHRMRRGIDLRSIHYQIQADLPATLIERAGPHAAHYCPMKTLPGAIAEFVPPPFTSEHTSEWAAAWIGRTDVAYTISMADCLGFFVLSNHDRAALERDLARLEGFRPYEIAYPITP